MPVHFSSRTWTNIVLAVVSTVVAIVAAEALARIIGLPPEFGRIMPVRDVPTRVVDGVALWSEKYPRYDQADLERVAAGIGTFKIVGLGDSIMYGVWLEKDDTYLEQTRRSLAGRTKRSVEALNFATPGFNTMQEAAVFKEIADQVKPNLVIVHYWGDDAHQYRLVGGYIVDVGDISDDGRLVVRALPLPPRLSDFLLVHSRLYDLLTHFVLAHRPSSLPRDDWSRVSKPLAEIQERAQRSGGRLLVLASPELTGPVPKPVGDIAVLQQFASTLGIEVIDLSEWLRGVDTKQIALDGVHFNAEGHRLIGERLAEYLLQHDLKE